MILKSYIVEQDIEILKKFQAALIFGENNGIKDDIKDRCIKCYDFMKMKKKVVKANKKRKGKK